MILFSKSTGGFYDTDIHGDRVPGDVKEISAERHRELMDGNCAGMTISADDDGFPILVDPLPQSHEDAIKSQISSLEATITARRLREAVLGTDNGWLAAVDQQIADLRAQL